MCLKSLLIINCLCLNTLLTFRQASSSNSKWKPPHIIEHPTDMIVTKNEPVTLNCKADGYPTPSIEWYKDGVKVHQTHNRLMLHGSLFFLRVFHNKKDPDTGTYWCIARNEVGTAKSQNATLAFAYLKEEFKLFPKSVISVSGETVILECIPPRGYPEPTVVWKKDGNIINLINDRIKLIKGSNIMISNVHPSDKGSYTCVAQNMIGSRESQPAATLKVMVKPYFIQAPETITTLEGESVEFSCKVDGDPSPSITWTKKNGKLPFERTQIKENKALKIHQVTVADQGVYFCEAANQGGIVSASATLTIQVLPQFNVKPKSQVTAALNSLLLVDCSAHGRPDPLIFWDVESSWNLLSAGWSNGRLSISSKGTLTIAKVQKEDQGYYYCSAVSSIGSVSESVYLAVQSIASHLPPIIRIGPFDQTLLEETDAFLPCQVSTSAKVKWLFNGKPLTGDEQRLIVLDSNTLQIVSLQTSDSGDYTCLASNEYGQSSWTSSILIKPFLEPNVAFNSFQDVSQNFQIPSKPSPLQITNTSITLTWSKDERSINFIGFTIEYFSSSSMNKGWITAVERILESTYTIKDLTPATSYVFQIRPETTLGLGPPSLLSDELYTLSTSNSKFNPELDEARLSLGSTITRLIDVRALNSSSVKLSWDVQGDKLFIESFLIRFREEAKIETEEDNMNFEQFTLKAASPFSCIITNLRPFTNYSFLLSPFYKSIQGPLSNLKSVQTPEHMPSSSPSNVWIKMINQSSAKIWWSPIPVSAWNGGHQGYLLRLTSLTSKFKDDLNLSANETSIVLTNLTFGHDYEIQIAGHNSAGLGPFSVTALLQMVTDYSYSSSGHLWPNILKDSKFTKVVKNPLFIFCAILVMFLFSFLIFFLFARKHLNWNKSVGAYISIQMNKCDEIEKYGLKARPWLSESLPSKCYINEQVKPLFQYNSSAGYEPSNAACYAEAECSNLVTFGKKPTHSTEPYATTTLTNHFERQNGLKQIECFKKSINSNKIRIDQTSDKKSDSIKLSTKSNFDQSTPSQQSMKSYSDQSPSFFHPLFNSKSSSYSPSVSSKHELEKNQQEVSDLQVSSRSVEDKDGANLIKIRLNGDKQKRVRNKQTFQQPESNQTKANWSPRVFSNPLQQDQLDQEKYKHNLIKSDKFNQHHSDSRLDFDSNVSDVLNLAENGDDKVDNLYNYEISRFLTNELESSMFAKSSEKVKMKRKNRRLKKTNLPIHYAASSQNDFKFSPVLNQRNMISLQNRSFSTCSGIYDLVTDDDYK